MIITGDFNASPSSNVISIMTSSCIDNWSLHHNDEGFTFPADIPTRRIDYVFTTKQNLNLKSLGAFIPNTLASDHRPVVVQF